MKKYTIEKTEYLLIDGELWVKVVPDGEAQDEVKLEELPETQKSPNRKPRSRTQKRADVLRDLDNGMAVWEVAEKYGMSVDGVKYYRYSEKKKQKKGKETKRGEKEERNAYRCPDEDCKGYDVEIISTVPVGEMKCPDCRQLFPDPN